jgi:hypothetical protein
MLTSLLRGALLSGLLAAAVVMPASRNGPARSEIGARASSAREPRRAPQSGEPVQAQMRNVDYRVISSAVLNIHRLRGELHSKVPGKPPVFDDKNSFVLQIHSAEIGVSEKSMAGLFNDHVFAYPGSPLSKIAISIEPDRVIQKGVLRTALRAPFSIAGAVSLTPEGDIRVHPTSIRVAGMGVRRLMKIFGLELEKLVKLKQDRGVRIDGNDFLISAGGILPPPQIQGKVTAVRLEQGRMVLTFGSAGQRPLSPPDRSAPNYMYYQGGTLTFGRLTMKNAELQIVDADPSDPFDFFLDHYNEQLVAGYDQNLPDHGLLVHMPDYGKIGKPGAIRDKPRVAALAPH